MNWRDEYVQALSDRDIREKESYSSISEEFIDAFTKLLERCAVLEAQNESQPNVVTEKGSKELVEGNGQLKSDLAEALRSNGQLQTRIRNADAELTELRKRTKADARRIEVFERERSTLVQKVKDRDEELKGKARLLENVQDEMITLNLQLNISEQNAKKLKAENKDLIDRWMARKEKEADEMNQRLG